MHNSLHIRKQLREFCKDPVFLERRDPHRNVFHDPAAIPENGDFILEGEWSVECNVPTDVASAILTDVEDFCSRIDVHLIPAGGHPLIFAIDSSLQERDCRLSFKPEKIIVAGGGVSGLWAGVAWLEWEMRTRRGPFLPIREFIYTAAWPVQISQGPAGCNYSVPDFSTEYLDNDAFRLYAHYGVTSMMIYGDLLCYVQSGILPELNHPDYEEHIRILQDAAERAGRYGIRFTYVPVAPKLLPCHPVFTNHPECLGTGMDRAGNGRVVHCLCSSSNKVKAFYEETFAALFEKVSELAGVILITFCESFNHCRICGSAQQPCPICSERPVAEMIAGLIEAVDRGIKSSSRNAFTAMWMYSNAWYHGNKLDFYRSMPEQAAIFYHLEKDGVLVKQDYRKLIWDYSISSTGPTPMMTDLAKLAHETGRSLFVKTETATGAEFMQFPYVPAMWQLADKWERVRQLRPYGVHQSWLFFGMLGSRAEELGLWAAYRRDMSVEQFLSKIAARDFGPECVGKVLAAWDALSRSVRQLPCLTMPYYYCGPGFLGPCHPLLPHPDFPIPELFTANLYYLQENQETFSASQVNEERTNMVMTCLPVYSRDIYVFPDDVVSYGWEIVIREYAAAVVEAETAWKTLVACQSLVEADAYCRNLAEEAWVTELIYRTLLACEHTVRFLFAYRNHQESGESKYLMEMKNLAWLEKDNALSSKVIYQELPWLDIKNRLDGKFPSCIAMIDEKVRIIEKYFAF